MMNVETTKLLIENIFLNTSFLLSSLTFPKQVYFDLQKVFWKMKTGTNSSQAFQIMQNYSSNIFFFKFWRYNLQYCF